MLPIVFNATFMMSAIEDGNFFLVMKKKAFSLILLCLVAGSYGLN